MILVAALDLTLYPSEGRLGSPLPTVFFSLLERPVWGGGRTGRQYMSPKVPLTSQIFAAVSIP